MTTSPIRPLRPEAEPQVIREFDHERAEAAVRELLYAIGEDPTREGLLDTPARVARAYAELNDFEADTLLAFDRNDVVNPERR